MKRKDIERELMELTVEKGVNLGILCVKEICSESDWNKWANHWLKGKCFWREWNLFGEYNNRGYGRDRDEMVVKNTDNMAAQKIVLAAIENDVMGWASHMMQHFNRLGTTNPQRDLVDGYKQCAKSASVLIVDAILLATQKKNIDIGILKQKIQS